MLVSACSTQGVKPSSTPAKDYGSSRAVVAGGRWYQTCFRFHFDSDGRPDWAIDMVVADRIAAPALETYHAKIALWRFHRRSAPTKAGHQFTLGIFTDEHTYDAIKTFIDESATLGSLSADGYIRRVIHDCRRSDDPTKVSAIADPSWPAPIQRAWPYFIMGASASWLALVQEHAATLGPVEGPLPHAYSAVEEQVSSLWRDEGQHAYLHHLSAIFGYHPLAIRKFIQF